MRQRPPPTREARVEYATDSDSGADPEEPPPDFELYVRRKLGAPPRRRCHSAHGSSCAVRGGRGVQNIPPQGPGVPVRHQPDPGVPHQVLRDQVRACARGTAVAGAHRHLVCVRSSWFDYFMLVAILANCVTLAMNDPPEEFEYTFTGLFAVEMFLKIFGLGEPPPPGLAALALLTAEGRARA